MKYSQKFNKILDNSVFLKSIADAKDIVDNIRKKNSRKLTESEIIQLKSQYNFSDNWNKIIVSESFTTKNIQNNRFMGDIYLGKFSGRDIAYSDTIFSTGIYNSTIVNSMILDEALIFNTSLLSNYIVQKGVSLISNMSISAGKDLSFGNNQKINMGPETGERKFPIFSEINIQIAESVILNKEFRKKYNSFAEKYSKLSEIDFGIIEENSIIANSLKIKDSFIGNSTLIDGVISVENSSIISSRDDPVEITDGVIVKNSTLQFGTKVTSMAIVENSVMMEFSCGEYQAKIIDSIIGPNSEIAKGEVTSSLLGPFIGFHHQSMLISAIWPEGKGNVGYGANVGSNHTSRLPDQEIFPGEGAFFGLGVNIKFPADFRDSPYTLIATGVTTLPQKVSLPFSLINSSSHFQADMSPAINEIFPAWGIYKNLFSLFRNIIKYKERDKSKNIIISADVFRADIIKLVENSLHRLLNADKNKEIFLEADIAGLGKNYLTKENLLKGIEGYKFFIKYYDLNLLLTEIEKKYNSTEKNIYYKELTILEIIEKLQELKKIDKIFLEKSKLSLLNDNKRGEKIIFDYNDIHDSDNEIIKKLEFIIKAKEISIDKIIKLLKGLYV
jgi:uncharacterized protein DUF4954